MKFKKFMAISLVAMLSTASLFGCGKKEDGEETADKKTEASDNKEDEKASPKSLSEMIKATEDFKNYTMDAEYTINVETDLLAEEEEVTAVLDLLEIDPEKIEVTLGYDATVCGTEAGKVAINYELGKLSGMLTEVVYVDEMIYVNVGSIIDIVDEVGEMLDMSTEMDAVLTLLPEEDYLAIPMDDVTEVGEAFLEALEEESGMSMEDLKSELEKVDEEKVLDATYYIVDEVEKIFKETEGAYSNEDGISVTINNKNLNSFVEAALTVIVEDAVELVEKLEVLVGDMGMSEDEIKEAMAEVDIEEAMKEFEAEMEGFDDVCDFTANYDVDFKDDIFSVDMKVAMDITEGDEAMKMTVSAKSSMTKDDKAKVEAPKSVVSEEDIEALVSLMGFESVEDFKQGLIDSVTSSSSYDDYDDFEYDYDSEYEELETAIQIEE